LLIILEKYIIIDIITKSASFVMILTVVYLIIIWILVKHLADTSSSEYMKSGPTTIYWFYRPGCPHCDNMKEEWSALASSDLPSNYILTPMDTSQPSNQPLAKKYNVRGVPHIIKVNAGGNIVSEYKGPRTMQAMKQWIIS
jgi:thioredoxin-related protein